MNNATTNKSKFHIETWGCQMNYADSGKIKRLLNELGLVEAKKLSEAGLVILNTCSVRQKAEDKVAGLGRKFIDLKSENPEAVIVMTGCMGQRICRMNDNSRSDDMDTSNENAGDSGDETSKSKGNRDNGANYDIKYQQTLRRRLEWIDYFVHIGDLGRLKDIVAKKFDVAPQPLKSVNEKLIKSDYMNHSQLQQSEVTAYVPISKGCDNFCTYCIVPFTRGREESRSLESIIKEVEELVKNGYKLITLLGQNVNSYQDEIDGEKVGFPVLLNRLCEIEGDFWLTFLTSHPKDFSPELVDTMKDCDKICNYLNLPVQSGSNRILQKMNRNYTWRDYIEKIAYLREKLPDISLSTDIIVGFPGETEEDFLDTYNLVKKIGFDMAYVSPYSPREGSASAKLDDNVTRDEKKRRKKKVSDTVTEFKKERNEEQIGQKVKILVVGEERGKTFELRDVILKGKGWEVNEFNKGKIIDAHAGGLVSRKV